MRSAAWLAVSLLLGAGILPDSLAAGETVENIVLDVSAAGFGEDPEVSDDTVYWRRQGSGPGGVSTVRCLVPMSPDLEGVAVAEYPATIGGFVPARTHLFFGSTISGGPLRAASRLPGCEPVGSARVLSEGGRAVAANDEYVFIEQRVDDPDYPLRFSAVRIADIATNGGVFVPIARAQRATLATRTEAASNRYFVFEDREYEQPGDTERTTWKIYVIDLSEGVTEFPEPVRAIDTYWDRLGAHLSLHESLLCYVGNEARRKTGVNDILLIDLDRDEPPIRVAAAGPQEDALRWPWVSSDYVVWCWQSWDGQVPGPRRLWAWRLVDGRPRGDPFDTGPCGGWPRVERNLVTLNISVWNDESRRYDPAILLRELDLPGADDVGDVDLDGRRSIVDAVAILRFLFSGGTRPRLRLADANRDRRIDVSDAIVVLYHLFAGGPRPGDPEAFPRATD